MRIQLLQLAAARLLALMLSVVAGQMQNGDRPGVVVTHHSDGRVSVNLTSLYHSEDSEQRRREIWLENENKRWAWFGLNPYGTGGKEKMMPMIGKMKHRKLLLILDTDLDLSLVSLKDPNSQKGPRSTSTSSSTDSEEQASSSPGSPTESKVQPVDPQLAALVARLNVSVLTDELGRQQPIDARTQHMFKTWLAARAACPMHHLWEDLGELFWPRWVRRGVCSDTGGSCSWPPGMRCRESSRKSVRLLRWVCITVTKRGDQDPRDILPPIGSWDPESIRKHQLRRQRQRERKRKRRARRRKERRRSAKSGQRKRRGSKITRLPKRWTRQNSFTRRLKRASLINNYSQVANGFFCYWKQMMYPVLNSCSCECSNG